MKRALNKRFGKQKKEPQRAVEIHGIGPQLTRMTLVMYLESRERSGGGPVEQLNYIDSTQAVVTFFDPKAAERLIKKRHLFVGLHEILYVYPLGKSPQDNKPGVKVTGINSRTTLFTLWMFLESTIRSMGGPIERLDYNYEDNSALVTFKEEAVTQRVLQNQGPLGLDDSFIRLEPCDEHPNSRHTIGDMENWQKGKFTMSVSGSCNLCSRPWRNPVHVSGFNKNAFIETVSYIPNTSDPVLDRPYHICNNDKNTLTDCFQKPKELSRDDIAVLSQSATVIRQWAILMRSLGLTEGQITSAEADNPKDVKAAVTSCLFQWKDAGGAKATTHALLKCLWKMNIKSVEGIRSRIQKLTVFGSQYQPCHCNVYDMLQQQASVIVHPIALSKCDDEMEILFEHNHISTESSVQELFFFEQGAKVILLFQKPRESPQLGTRKRRPKYSTRRSMEDKNEMDVEGSDDESYEFNRLNCQSWSTKQNKPGRPVRRAASCATCNLDYEKKNRCSTIFESETSLSESSGQYLRSSQSTGNLAQAKMPEVPSNSVEWQKDRKSLTNGKSKEKKNLNDTETVTKE